MTFTKLKKNRKIFSVLVLKDDEYSVKREIDNSYEHDHDRDHRRVFVRQRSGSLADQPYSPSARPNR